MFAFTPATWFDVVRMQTAKTRDDLRERGINRWDAYFAQLREGPVGGAVWCYAGHGDAILLPEVEEIYKVWAANQRILGGV